MMNFEILFATPGLCVVNKPPDVAMDGDAHAHTVQGWVTSDAGQQALRAAGAIGAPPPPSQLPPTTPPPHHDRRHDDDGVDGKLRFVHQLDYATSGLLALAFSRTMAARLAFCFESRATRKEYLAIVHGWVDQAQLNRAVAVASAPVAVDHHRDEEEAAVWLLSPVLARCVIPFAVGPDPSDERGFRMQCGCRPQRRVRDGETTEDAPAAAAPPPPPAPPASGDARAAATIMTVAAHGFFRNNAAAAEGAATTTTRVSLVRLQLLTGRRHQLRVHCAAVGSPILGDMTYSSGGDAAAAADAAAPRMMLHAWRLALPRSAIAAPASRLKERLARSARRRDIKTVRATAAASTHHGNVNEDRNDDGATIGADEGGAESTESMLSLVAAAEPLLAFFVRA